MMTTLTLLTLMMFFYSNTMFYTLTLLIMVIVLLSQLVYLNYLTVLSSLMLALVYIGAMMILIGYICAISPNLNTFSPLLLHTKVVMTSAMLALTLFFYSASHSVFSTATSPVSYLFGAGYPLLGMIVFLLFISLLMVTSQYSSPRGPFRAL